MLAFTAAEGTIGMPPQVARNVFGNGASAPLDSATVDVLYRRLPKGAPLYVQHQLPSSRKDQLSCQTRRMTWEQICIAGTAIQMCLRCHVSVAIALELVPRLPTLRRECLGLWKSVFYVTEVGSGLLSAAEQQARACTVCKGFMLGVKMSER